MSSRVPAAGGIAERRVRPLWDAIDTRQYKTALKLATALLAKHPDSAYIQALKALVLERIGKPDEALSLCLNAKDVGPVDDLTLSTLQIVFQRLDHLDLATSCYEYACSKIPNNLELMMGLFNCYVREYSYVKQQQTAMKMYKLVGEERFLLWAVCSIQLQVSCENGGEKLLSLAEALLKKRIESHGLRELEALLVYISILEQQHKYELALDVLDSKLGGLFSIDNDRLRIQGKLLIRACEYAKAAEVSKKVLETCLDDWEIFLQYLDCSLELNVVGSTESISKQDHIQQGIKLDPYISSNLTEEEFDSRLSTVRSFVRKLQETQEFDVRRGPYLANIEIAKRQYMSGKSDAGEFMQAILDYFTRFGHLASFASDVDGFLRFVEPGQRAMLFEKFHEIRSQISYGDPVKELGRTIAVFQVKERFDMISTASDEELVAHAVSLARLYLENLSLSKDLDPQESMHGEELLSMACNILVQLFWRSRHLGYFLEAILVLEFGLSIRRYIWQYRVMLVHMYTHWAAISLAFEWYKTLEIKNIMLESMSHHIFPQILSSPLWSELNNSLKEYLKFHEDHMKEAADLTFLVYRHCNYSKVLEFVKFRERLQNSHQYLLVRIESAILHLKEKADKLEEAEHILANLDNGIQLLEWSDEKHLNSLSFNEDLQTRPWWSPAPDQCYLSGHFEAGISPQEETLECQNARENRWRTSIQRRCLLPRLIYLALQSVSFLKGMEEGKTHHAEGNCAELKLMLERYARTLGLSFDEAVGILNGIASNQKSFKEIKLDMVDCVSLAVFYNAWSLSAEGFQSLISEKRSMSSLNIVDQLMALSVSELVESTTSSQYSIAECLVKVIPPGFAIPTLLRLVTESFAWHGLILQSWVRSLSPAGKKKKRGGATGSPADGSYALILELIQNSVVSLSSTIEKIMFWLEGYLDKSEDQELDSLLSLLMARDELDARPECSVLALPGCVLRILETSSTMASELGPRIGQAVQTWNASACARKLVSSQHMVVSRLHDICTFKLKSLKALKQAS